MVVADDLRDMAERRRSAQDVRADRRVATHHLPLLLVEWSRLVQHRVRDRDLADVVQLGRADELRGRCVGHPEPPRDAQDELGDVLRVMLDVRLLHAQDLDREVPRLLTGAGAARVLLGVHPLVRKLHRQIGIGRVDRDEHASVRACDRERLTGLAERVEATAHGLLVGAAGEERAELVPSEAVARSLRCGGDCQGSREPGQQEVAAMMTERVVVGLEAVEVEDDEPCRALFGRASDRDREIARELSTVRKPRQGVVRGLLVELVGQA